MVLLKHIDFEVGQGVQASLSPLIGVTLRPDNFRPDTMRPSFFRCQFSSSDSTLNQSAAASFPDRPTAGGAGLVVGVTAVVDGQYLAHDLGQGVDPLHVRLLVAPANLGAGVVTLARGLDSLGGNVFDADYHAASGQFTVTLSTSQTLTATLGAGMAWHALEWGIDATGGQATLWLNGVVASTVAGAFSALVTQTVQIGCVSRDATAVGELSLDEWVMADGYIGPVVVAPTGVYADDPARWVVLYNTDVPESEVWAQSYQQVRSVPYANFIGLALGTVEVINQTRWLALRDAVSNYIATNAIDAGGILIGFGVPGVVQIGGVDHSMASLLADLWDDSTDLANPLYGAGLIGVEGLPPRGSLLASGRYLTAEINAPTLADAQALVTRSDALSSTTVDGKRLSTLDPSADRSAASEMAWSLLSAFDGSVEYQQLRLPVDPGYDGSQHGHAIEMTDDVDGPFDVTGQNKAIFLTVGDQTAQQIFS